MDWRNWTAPDLKKGAADMKKVWATLHDFAVTFAALMLSLALRGEPKPGPVAGLDPVIIALGFSVFALGVYHACSLYASRWRFASLFDLFGIFKAVCILTRPMARRRLEALPR